MANIVEKDSKYKIFNLGSGYGTSIQQLINVIGSTLGVDLKIKYLPFVPGATACRAIVETISQFTIVL